MLTSSMTSVVVCRHRAQAAPLLHTFSTSLAASPLPRPTPAHEWIVVPPMCDAAIPVGAVTATPPGRASSSASVIDRIRNDLPVPAAPVTKTLWPASARARTSSAAPR